jgi:branched-chain amino acid transport system substrate-binding protein
MRRKIGNPIVIMAILFIVITTPFFQGCERQKKEPAPQIETYRFGAVVPLTGPISALGDLIKRGLELGIEDANAKSQGRHIEAIFEDSKSNPSQGLTAFRKLIDVDKVDVVLVVASSICNAVAPVAEEAKVLMVGMTTSMPGLPDGRKYVIRLFPNADMLAGTIADYAKSKFSRAAVIYAEDEYGKNTFTTFRSKFQGEKRSIVFAEAFKPTDTEFRSTVVKMMEAKPDVIYLPGYGPGYIALINQIRERDANIPIMGDSPLTNPPVYRAAGNAAEGVIVPATPLDAGVAETPAQKEFLERYRARFNENPSINIAINYDFIQLLAGALEKTDQSPEAIRGTATKRVKKRCTAIFVC